MSVPPQLVAVWKRVQMHELVTKVVTKRRAAQDELKELRLRDFHAGALYQSHLSYFQRKYDNAINSMLNYHREID